MARIMAIDYGRKRCGIAVTDPLQIIANSLTTVATKDLLTFIMDYVKKENAGIVSWSGNRCELPEHLNACDKYSVVSPFKYHYYFNVVTYGYTMPYWDWELQWVEQQRGVSEIKPFRNTMKACRTAL